MSSQENSGTPIRLEKKTFVSSIDFSILRDRVEFPSHVMKALALESVDYLGEFEFIDQQRRGQGRWGTGGVLVPLFFRGEENRVKEPSGQYVFLLSKRSKNVQQPGDLCAPGGGIHPRVDWLLGKLLGLGLFSGICSPGSTLAGRPRKRACEKLFLLLGNALRESWEELRLSPFNVEFLGPLPAYRLYHRPWIIFPLVGRVKHFWKARLNWEVEKIVSIPLESFFHSENHAIYSLEVPENLADQGIPNPWEFPCLVHQEGGEEEILWGATFEIIRTFFRIVFDFSLPFPDQQRVIRRPLASNYLSGKRRS